MRNNPLRYADPNGTVYQICTTTPDGQQSCTFVSDLQFQLAQESNGQGGNYLANGNVYYTDPSGNIVQGGTYSWEGPDLEPSAVAALGGTWKMSSRALGYINDAFDAFFTIVAPMTMAEATPTLMAAGFGRDAAEVANILDKAAGVVGDQDITVSSEKGAQDAANRFLGPGKQPITQEYGSRAGQQVGWKSADGQRIVRVDTNAADPHYNFVNKATGGNLHVYF